MLKKDGIWLAGVALSVLVTYFSFPPYPLGLLMFVALAPVFYALDTAATWKAAALRGWIFGLFAQAAVFAWFTDSFHDFTGLPGGLGYPVLFLFSAIDQLTWALLGASRHIVHRKYGVRPLFWTPAAALVLEAVWPRFFQSTLGDVFYSLPLLAQIADVTAVWGLTALLVATNEVVAAAAQSFLRTGGVDGAWAWPRWELKRHGIATAALLVAGLIYGGWRLTQVRGTIAQSHPSMRFSIVQPNVNVLEKLRGHSEAEKEIHRMAVLERLLMLTAGAREQKPDVVFWPESAFTDDYRGDTRIEKHRDDKPGDRLEDYVTRGFISVMFGADDDQAGYRYNSLFLLRPSAIPVSGLTLATLKTQIYHKHHHTFNPPAREKIGPPFAKGHGAIVFETPKARLGPTVSHDAVFPRLVRRIALEGAQILVNGTNDSWFMPGREPVQHLYFSAFRSIETRRPMVRATTNGISGIIDIDGSLRARIEPGTEQVLTQDVPVYPDIRTPYMVIGDALVILAGLWALLPFLKALTRRNRAAPKA